MTGILILDPDPEDRLQMQNWVWRIFLQRAQHDADDEIRKLLHQGEVFQTLGCPCMSTSEARRVIDALLGAIDGTIDDVRHSGHPSEAAHLEVFVSAKERLRRYSADAA